MKKDGWETVVIAASGPSLASADVASARGRARVIAVNDSWRMATWADAIYACDEAWWSFHYKAVMEKFGGERWSQRPVKEIGTPARVPFELNYVGGSHAAGLCRTPGQIHYGSNSGYQAMNLAWHFGARRILLLGFDMRMINGRRHWFGEHPKGLTNSGDYSAWIQNFAVMARDLRQDGVEVINCTKDSALEYWPIKPIVDVV